MPKFPIALLRALAKLKKKTVVFLMSIRPSVLTATAHFCVDGTRDLSQWEYSCGTSEDPNCTKSITTRLMNTHVQVTSPAVFIFKGVGSYKHMKGTELKQISSDPTSACSK
jgi:hypothetical protein